MGTLQVFTVGGGTLDISTAQLERDSEKVGVLPKATQLGKARTQTSLALRHLALKPLIPLCHPLAVFATGHLAGLSLPLYMNPTAHAHPWVPRSEQGGRVKAEDGRLFGPLKGRKHITPFRRFNLWVGIPGSAVAHRNAPEQGGSTVADRDSVTRQEAASSEGNPHCAAGTPATPSTHCAGAVVLDAVHQPQALQFPLLKSGAWKARACVRPGRGVEGQPTLTYSTLRNLTEEWVQAQPRQVQLLGSLDGLG